MSRQSELAELGRIYSQTALSNRNLIINGAMKVAQRGTSSTTNASFTTDRFINFQNIGTFTAEQSTDAPDGFQYSLKRTNGTGTTATSSDYSLVRYQVEGFDAVQLSQATSSAKTVTISFWVKSSVTGTYFVALTDANDLVQYPAAYTVNSANIWEKKEVTITGYTGSSGTWNKDNTIGLKIHWDLGSGPSRQAPTADAWNTSLSGSWSHSSQVDWVGTTGATFYLTGVQLEVGDTATPFEHRSYGDELARCQRYFISYGRSALSNNAIYLGIGQAVTSTNAAVTITPPVTMRASPTFSSKGVDSIVVNNGTSRTSTSLSGGDSKPDVLFVSINTTSGMSTAQAVRAFLTGNHYISFDAEL